MTCVGFRLAVSRERGGVVFTQAVHEYQRACHQLRLVETLSSLLLQPHPLWSYFRQVGSAGQACIDDRSPGVIWETLIRGHTVRSGTESAQSRSPGVIASSAQSRSPGVIASSGQARIDDRSPGVIWETLIRGHTDYGEHTTHQQTDSEKTSSMRDGAS